MLTPEQNTVIYLMFLNGILFWGLTCVAEALIIPKNPKSRGYASILAAILAMCVQQEYRSLIMLGIAPEKTISLLSGFIVPVFLISLVYYRFQKIRRNNQNT